MKRLGVLTHVNMSIHIYLDNRWAKLDVHPKAVSIFIMDHTCMFSSQTFNSLIRFETIYTTLKSSEMFNIVNNIYVY